jgi:transposase
VGKKNWLFIGAAQTGATSAVLDTIIQECRRLRLNPEEYLTMALTRLPAATNHDVHTLTPKALAPILGQHQAGHAQAA